MKKIFLIILLVSIFSCEKSDDAIISVKSMTNSKKNYFKELNINYLGEYPLFLAQRYVTKKAKSKDIVWEHDEANSRVIATYKHLRTVFPYKIDHDGFRSVDFYDIETCDISRNECADPLLVIADVSSNWTSKPIFERESK